MRAALSNNNVLKFPAIFNMSCVPITAPDVAAWTIFESSDLGMSYAPRLPMAVGLSSVSGKVILEMARAAGADMTEAARIATGSTPKKT